MSPSLRHLVLCAALISATASWAAPPPATACALPKPFSSAHLPVFIQFYDWFQSPGWKEDTFVDPLDWAKLGISGPDRSSKQFYEKQFRYIRSLGIDALSWEYHALSSTSSAVPSPAAIAAMQATGMQIAPFYDLEISLKFRHQPDKQMKAIFAPENSIQPTQEMVDYITEELGRFYSRVPKNLLARDRKGRLVIFVFGFGFDDSGTPAQWSSFGHSLASAMKKMLGETPTFYWTFRNSRFPEHLFLHHRDVFVPFHFVLDMPQAQFAHDSVSWNFGFDNLAVLKRDHLQRVVRLDPRYVEEPAWLASAASPSLLYIYGWNEPFEGSMLLPTRHWGDVKARLAAHYIRRLRTEQHPLPKTLLIVDDLDEGSLHRKDDWRLLSLREALWYSLRRFLPQADVRMPSEVCEALLESYDVIVDASAEKDPAVSRLIAAQLGKRQVMVFDPLAGTRDATLTRPFVEGDIGGLKLHEELELVGTGQRLFARDDVVRVRPCHTCGVHLRARSTGPGGAFEAPIIISNRDDVWVNSYAWNEEVLRHAFGVLYGRPMGKSILYGEGMSSQRLEVDPDSLRYTYNQLSRYSVNLRWRIPADIDWYRPLLEVPPEHYRFVYGLDAH